MSEEIIRVMIVDDVADTCDQLEKLLFFEKDIEVVAKAHNGREAVDAAKKLKPDVILMDINMPEMDGIAATEAITADDPSIQVIIMSVQGETDYLRRAMLAGAREFLIKPVGADDLYKSIRHVHKLGATRPRPVAGRVDSGGDGAAPSGDQPKGQLLAVFSPKGGAGTSAVAANLAIALRQLTGRKVALVDGNLTLGDLNVILNLVSSTTVVDLARRVSEIDRDLLNDVLVTHGSQIKVLLAPPNPQDGETVSPEQLQAILEAMRREFDYVVVDTFSSFTQDRALSVLDVADRIILLMTLEMTCIKNIKLFLEVADLLAYSREKIFLVLNKADNRMGMRVDKVESTIRHKVALQIGNAGQDMALSINQGVPLVIGKRDHPVSRDIFLLARELSGVVTAAALPEVHHPGEDKPTPKARDKPQRGFFGRLF
ncbi:MAG: MinD/ParA family protein [Chloroflexaceae bacterium]|nr:MinD/ParA family protein [Chloroflexaceae bacterium]